MASKNSFPFSYPPNSQPILNGNSIINDNLSTINSNSGSQLFGQLCVNRKIAELKRNAIIPPKPTYIKNQIEHSPLPKFPEVSEVTVTQVIKHKFLAANNTRDHQFLIPQIRHNQTPNRQPTFNNNQPCVNDLQSQPMFHVPTNQSSANHPFVMNSSVSGNDHYPITTTIPSVFTHQPPTISRPNHCFYRQNHSNPHFIEPYTCGGDRIIPDPQPISVSADPHRNIAHIQIPNNHQDPGSSLGLHHQFSDNSPLPFMMGNNAFNQINPGSSSGNDKGKIIDDGQTHSLPCPKYGPYICPKCYHVFVCSQAFASHVFYAHYKFETSAEKERRLAARSKKKNLRIAERNNELISVPESFIPENNILGREDGMGVKLGDEATGNDVTIKNEPANE